VTALGLLKPIVCTRKSSSWLCATEACLCRSLRYPITPSGLHYLLIHYDVPEVNADEWRLKVGGQVARPFNLTLEEIKKRPSQTIAVTMECAGNGRALFAPRRISQPWLLEAIGTAKWTGTPLWGILEEAGIGRDAVEVVFTGLDRGVEGDQVQFYQRRFIVGEARREEVLLVYEMNGEPLPPQHGYPLRLLVPGWYGMASVKWLDRIEAVAEPGIPDGSGLSLLPIGGRSWRAGQRDQGARVDGSPGIPDFMTRTRLVHAGQVTLSGKAWAGPRSVARVEVSVDAGSTWSEAQLDEAVSSFAWMTLTFVWNARPGACTLCVRATDSDGNVQPMEQQWNFGGYGNNGVQRISVIVE
jgi:DMSO/TMAO reductase YedYZ molybdopterin-dependent catalytic subunit